MVNLSLEKVVTIYMLSKEMNPAYLGFAYFREAFVHMLSSQDNYLRRQYDLYKVVGAKFGVEAVLVARNMERFAHRLGKTTSNLLQTCYIELSHLDESD